MSEQYPGGFITRLPPTPSGPFSSSTAQGLWNLSQQAAYRQQGLWPTQGNLGPEFFIENLFQTALYSGTQATQTISNGIDLTGKGGLVWLKSRAGTTLAGYDKHILFDTVRGNTVSLSTSNTGANEAGWGDSYLRFLSNGFDTGTGGSSQQEYLNKSGVTYTSWTFREQAKFFDIVTYTGDGTGNRAIPHNLGSTPGFITTKRTNTPSNWVSYHRVVTSPNANWWRNYGYLDLTDPFIDFGSDAGLSQAPDANNIYVGSYFNASGTNYIFYVYAHNAGGFGNSGTDNVVSCGGYTGNGAALGPVVNLGYEPQWVMVKRATGGTGSWYMVDNMRGFVSDSQNSYATADLRANSTDGEFNTRLFNVTSTGFQPADSDARWNNSGDLYIYIAIRRGPMRTPTSGASVFAPQLYTGTGSSQTITGPTNAYQYDSLLQKGRSGTLTSYAGNGYWVSKLQQMSTSGNSSTGLGPAIADAEISGGITNYSATGFSISGGSLNISGTPYVNYWLRRAPTFFDQVCYTGTGTSTQVITHNLGVAPEWLIVKRRNGTSNWTVYSRLSTGSQVVFTRLNTTDATPFNVPGTWLAASTFTAYQLSEASSISNDNQNVSGGLYVAYLFASCPGVSKVGSYTGTGTTQTINCGFTGGARFVMIKRTDSTGDWYVWDTARGMIPANDPYLLLNSTAAEVTGTDFVDTAATGFQITSTAPAAINASGGTFIFLAIA